MFPLFFHPPSPAYSRPKTMALNTLLLFTTHLLVLAPISSHSSLPTKYSHFSDTLSSSNLRHNLFHPRSPIFLQVSASRNIYSLFLDFIVFLLDFTHSLFLQPDLKIREPFKKGGSCHHCCQFCFFAWNLRYNYRFSKGHSYKKSTMHRNHI